MNFRWSNVNHTKICTFGARCRGLSYKGLRPDTVYITYTELKRYMTLNHHDLTSAEHYLHMSVYPSLAIKDSKVVLLYI